jgi:hypothetical protein
MDAELDRHLGRCDALRRSDFAAVSIGAENGDPARNTMQLHVTTSCQRERDRGQLDNPQDAGGQGPGLGWPVSPLPLCCSEILRDKLFETFG